MSEPIEISPALRALEEKVARRKRRKEVGRPYYVMPTDEQQAALLDAHNTYKELAALAERARRDRNRMVTELLQAHVSQIQIGKILGMSRARVYQLMKKEDV